MHDAQHEIDYRGPDRRGPARTAIPLWTGRSAALDLGLLVAACAVAVPLSVALHGDAVDEGAGLATGMAASIATTLAGFAALVRHRLAGEATMAYVGLGLLTYGGSVAPLTAIVAHLNGPAAADDLEALRLAAVVVMVPLLAGGLMVSEVDTSLSAARLAALSIIGVTACAAALATSSLQWGVAANDVTTRVMVPLWFGIAGGYLAAGLHRRRPAFWRLGAGLGVITVAHVVRAVEPSGHGAVAISLASVRLVGAVTILAGIVPDMLAALSARRLAEASMRERWAAAEAERLRVLRDASERRHEMANALAGIAGANFALGTDGPSGDGDNAALLRRAVQQEVERLRHLVVDAGPPEPDRPFLVGDVVRPLVAARRAMGERVTFTGDDQLVAFGSPEVCGQILVNLLANCARHATGGRVEVTATRVGGCISVHVIDDGPTTEVAPSTGSGIGLAVSSRLGQQHGARLRLLARPPGHRGFGIALDLPAAPLSPPTGDVVTDLRRRTAARSHQLHRSGSS